MKKNTKDNRMLRFALPAVLLCCAALTLLLLSVQKDREYRVLAQVTPIPTATIRSDIRIGSAGYMSAVTSAPSPTSVPLQNVPGASTQMPALYAAPVQTPVSFGTPMPTMAAATSAPEQSGSILLRSGSSGSQVKQLQERLQALGYYSGTVDGAFGSGTKKAVQQFQSQHGLDADGIVGEKTWSMLLSDEAKTFEPTPTPYLQDILSGETPFLINKSHPVGSDFVPNDLVYIRDIIPSSVAVLQSNNAQGVREAVEALKAMLEAALADGIGHWKVREAYRTYADQERIFNSYVERFISQGRSRSSAISATRQTVADPGTSEHHSGLAFDLNATDTDEAFAYTAQYAWLYNHCWEYGFIIRYTDEKEDITGFLGEEWHYRYVGKAHAQKIHELNICLEEYLDLISGR